VFTKSTCIHKVPYIRNVRGPTIGPEVINDMIMIIMIPGVFTSYDAVVKRFFLHTVNIS